MEMTEVIPGRGESNAQMILKEFYGNKEFNITIKDLRPYWLGEYNKRNQKHNGHIGSMCQEPSLYGTFSDIADALGFVYEVKELGSRYFLKVGEYEYQILYRDAVGFAQFTPNKIEYDKSKAIFPSWNLGDIDIDQEIFQMNTFLIIATVINDYGRLVHISIPFRFHNALMTFVCHDEQTHQIQALPETALALGMMCCSKVYVNTELMS